MITMSNGHLTMGAIPHHHFRAFVFWWPAEMNKKVLFLFLTFSRSLKLFDGGGKDDGGGRDDSDRGNIN
jgi:hypothetical protein